VIQRVGRINRINKKVFDRLNIYNFFPSATGEALSHTKRITTFKMLLIQTIFGSDTKILTADEITEGYLDDEFRKARAEMEFPSWSTEFSNEYYRIMNQDRAVLHKALALPQRCRTGRAVKTMAKKPDDELFENAGGSGVLLFSEKGDAYRFCFADENGGAVLSSFEGLSLFRASAKEKTSPVTEDFYPLYKSAKGMSGRSTEKTSNSKNIVEVVNKINFIIKKTPAISLEDKKYLEDIRKVTGELNALPLYYIRQLLEVKIEDIDNALQEFKNIIAEEYLAAIIEKDNRIMNETENIILSEQFI
jgi:hypothetical protein